MLAANHPQAQAIEPTSVTGTSNESPRTRPASAAIVTDADYGHGRRLKRWMDRSEARRYGAAPAEEFGSGWRGGRS